jgi:hypothetical protein
VTGAEQTEADMPKRERSLQERANELLDEAYADAHCSDVVENAFAVMFRFAEEIILLRDEITLIHLQAAALPAAEPVDDTDTGCDRCNDIAADILFVLRTALQSDDVRGWSLDNSDDRQSLIKFLSEDLSQFMEHLPELDLAPESEVETVTLDAPEPSNGSHAVPAAPLRPRPHSSANTVQGGTNSKEKIS